ncbi:MAG: hypothetical protein WD492_06145 [Alkalispirochaeta sp.]
MIGPELPDHSALRSSLITYIGNKRALLPLIWEGLRYLETHGGPLRTMADPFTGSGVVARLGRIAGLEVHAGDIEDYTRPFGTAFLETSRAEVEVLFAPWGGYAAVLAYLNSLTTPTREEDLYFARHYAPADTAAADPHRERLFYTRENALRIDAVAAAIHREELGPRIPSAGDGGDGAAHDTDIGNSAEAGGAEANGENGPDDTSLVGSSGTAHSVTETHSRSRRRDILLASLLVEMSVHNNTSGVMKGFHHGWGGRGGDALSRIMAPIELEALPFLDGPPGRMHVGRAHELPHPADGRPFDVTYLDPPYTIHQYGANYHLLTSAVRWDHYDPGPVVHGGRAGIRTDHYRSDHCRRRGRAAIAALETVLAAIPTRYLLVSYNNDGIIRPQEMLALLSEDGTNTVHLLNRRYHKFRGGKSTQGAVGTREYLFVVLRDRRQDQVERDALRAEIQQLAAERELHDRFMVPATWKARGGTVSECGTELRGPDGEVILLDDQLRVRAVDVPGEAAGAERARRRMEEASGGPVEAANALVAMEEWDAALRVLQRLKIKKYRETFKTIAADLEGASLSPAQRRRLAALKERVASA